MLWLLFSMKWKRGPSKRKNIKISKSSVLYVAGSLFKEYNLIKAFNTFFYMFNVQYNVYSLYVFTENVPLYKLIHPFFSICHGMITYNMILKDLEYGAQVLWVTDMIYNNWLLVKWYFLCDFGAFSPWSLLLYIL